MKGTSQHEPTEYVEPDPSLSSDAAHSTYEPAPEPDVKVYPPPGPGVIQTKGKPTERADDTSDASTSKRSSSKASTSKAE